MEQHYSQHQSKQFTRHISIQPITRTTSYGIDFRRKSPKPVKIKHRLDGEQNNYNLASMVQQILAMKPKTASNFNNKRNQARQKARAETIGNQCLKPEPHEMKAQPISLLNILRGKKQLCLEENTKKDEEGYKFLQVNTRSKHRNATSRTNNNIESEQHINFDTISYPEVRRKSQSKQSVKRIFKMNSIQLEQDCQDDKDIKKQIADKLLPKSKLTITNIDKIIIKESQRPPKQRPSVKYDIKKTELKGDSKNVSMEKDKTHDFIELTGGEKKSRKNIVNQKIPQFIKASLEGYKQESDFVINYGKANAVAQTASVQSNPISKPQTPPQIQNMGSQPSQENIMGAKFKLCTKDKRRTTRIGDYIRSKKQLEQMEQPQEQNMKPKTFKQKKKRREEDESIPEICGWQQFDLPFDNFNDKY